MKHITYILAFAMMIIIVACEEDNNSQLTTSATLVSFPTVGGSEVIEIESNTSWHIQSDATWLSVYPMKGSLNQSVTITAVRNVNTLEQEARIIISTNDGAKVVNVTVKTAGSQGKSGKYIEIDVNSKILSGKAGSMDSLLITANTSWELFGPAWIEAWDGGRWRSMSQERAVVSGSGNDKVYFRTVADNRNDENLGGTIVLQEYLTGDFSRSINIQQLGRLNVRPFFPCTLEDGIAIGWHCGCDVERIYYKVCEDLDEQFDSSLRDTYEVTDESYINSVTNLASGREYRLNYTGEDAQGNLPPQYGYGSIYTSSKYTYMADILKGEPVGNGQWQFLVNTSSSTHYQMYVTDNPNSAFRYADPILWYIAEINENRGMWYDDTQYISPGWVFWNNLSGQVDEIHAMAKASGSYLLRRKVFRYDRYYASDGTLLPEKPLLDRIPKAMLYDTSLR